MLFALASCKPGPVESPDTPTEPISEGESTTEAVTTVDPLAFPKEDPNREIVFFEDGKWTFNIVKPDVACLPVSRTVDTFRYRSSVVTNVGINLTTDYLATGQSYDENSYEILYGNTAHLQSISGYDRTCLGESGIFVIGNKIVICSYTDSGFAKCYTHLVELFTENLKDGKISAKVSEIEKMFNVLDTLSDVPRPDDLKFSRVENCDYLQTLYMFEGAKESDFDSYMKKFSEADLVQEKAEAGNRFATYQVGADLVNISYSKHDNIIRTIINENTTASAYLKDSESTVEKKTTNIIVMQGLGYGSSDADILDHQNGICILFRLSDGRFIIVDGGFNRQSDADKLYALLVKHTPSGMKPTVAAWLITHAHGDHHATFANKFVTTYKSRVEIQSVLFNPPSTASNKTASNERPAEDLIISVANSIEGCTFIRPHVGDRYYIGDAAIDFYFTIDQYYPKTFTYYNTCSLIFSVTIGGQKIMMNGDAANESFKEAIGMFGESLKCDIVQIAHHGYGTGVSDSLSTSVMQGYKYLSPALVLWPLGNEHYANLSTKVYNRYLTSLPSVKEIIVAGKAEHVINLPYTPPEK